jgi:hypothetical protein
MATSTIAASAGVRNDFAAMHQRTPRWRLATLIGVLVVGLWGCGSGGSETGGGPRHAGATRHHVHDSGRPVHHRRQPGHEPARRKAARPKPAPRPAFASLCPPASRTLAGVYSPDRLQVRDPCRRVTGVVHTVRSEEDGDIHLGIGLDPPYRGMLIRNNYSEQSGNLVVEFMPRDHGHLTEPAAGDRVTVIGAYVDDTDHDWTEIHPVFGFAANGRPLERSGPQYGGSPPSAHSDNAVATCRTSGGGRCAAYGGGAAPAPAAKPSPRPAGGNCDPNYAGACLDPNASDYDCAGGGGDGPKYTSRVRVVGTDHFNLDSDGDGIGCE